MSRPERIPNHRVGVGLAPTREKLTMPKNEFLPRRPNSLRLQGFDYSTAGVYFLTICTREKLPIFKALDKRQSTVDVAQDVSNSLKMYPIAICVMHDHLHLLLHISPDSNSSVSDFVRIFKSTLYREFRSVLGFKRSFWQRYYYDHIIRDERDFSEKY